MEGRGLRMKIPTSVMTTGVFKEQGDALVFANKVTGLACVIAAYRLQRNFCYT